MKVEHVEVGYRIVIPSDPMVHVVSWSNSRAWQAECGREDYQPDYPQNFTRSTTLYAALELDRIPEDVPVTCLRCLVSSWLR